MSIQYKPDYYIPKTKSEAIKFLEKYWLKSELMKKSRRSVMFLYHLKMKEIRYE